MESQYCLANGSNKTGRLRAKGAKFEHELAKMDFKQIDSDEVEDHSSATE